MQASLARLDIVEGKLQSFSQYVISAKKEKPAMHEVQ
jgi:hypothetical protein